MGEMKESQTSKILKLLKEKGNATNIELNKICYRYGARIHELRQEGYNIISVREKGSIWRFYLGENNE